MVHIKVVLFCSPGAIQKQTEKTTRLNLDGSPSPVYYAVNTTGPQIMTSALSQVMTFSSELRSLPKLVESVIT